VRLEGRRLRGASGTGRGWSRLEGKERKEIEVWCESGLEYVRRLPQLAASRHSKAPSVLEIVEIPSIETHIVEPYEPKKEDPKEEAFAETCSSQVHRDCVHGWV